MMFAEVDSISRMVDRNRLGPTCRRCGKPVEAVDAHHDLYTQAAVFKYRCHGAVHEHSVRVDGLMRFRPDSDWLSTFPTHVFDYEAVSFGAWDANGSPVEAA
jgi:hypothetical protein